MGLLCVGGFGPNIKLSQNELANRLRDRQNDFFINTHFSLSSSSIWMIHKVVDFGYKIKGGDFPDSHNDKSSRCSDAKCTFASKKI